MPVNDRWDLIRRLKVKMFSIFSFFVDPIIGLLNRLHIFFVICNTSIYFPWEGKHARCPGHFEQAMSY